MAGANPVIWDTDALGEVYRDSGAMVLKRGDVSGFTDAVVQTLNGVERKDTRQFAEAHTWTKTTERILELAGPLLDGDAKSNSPKNSEAQPGAS